MGIEFCQSFQRFIKREELVGALVRSVKRFIERDNLAAAVAFSGQPRPSMINQNAPHRLGGDAEEVGAVLPSYVSLIYQLDVSLVRQRRRLQRVTCAFSPHIALRKFL